ncbi:MAG: type II toxin-antitoxin system VapC family toxin [Armatimonadota bacterium]|nr:type II toxin-antitoxin system VapC family toxin [Armatimonadota bacterium]
MGAKVVVDTSVFIKWVKTANEDLVAEARHLLSEVEARAAEIHVPALLLYEVGNILMLKTRLSGRTLTRTIAHLETLPFKIAPPATPLLARAARVGRRFGLTFYDASFVALALELNCPFVTADRALYDRTCTLSVVRHLERVGSIV